MAKGAAILAIFFYCTYLGLSAAGRLKKRERLLSDLQSAVSRLLFDMHQTRLPVAKLLCRDGCGTAGVLLCAVGEALKHDQSMDKAWESAKAALHETGALSPLSRSDIEALDAFFPMLGATDLDGQMENGRRLKGRLSQAIAAAGEDTAVRGKLYRALGPLLGAAAALLMM